MYKRQTNEKGRLVNLFRAKKFVEDLYTEDKKNIITKYHEKGYRDAEIVRDTVYKHDEKTVNIEIDIEEGALYPVSYTHLDVYKRQTWVSYKGCPSRPG